MEMAGVKYDTYTEVVVEPTDTSFQHLIDYARKGKFDGFVGVGGGSVLDTVKAANLFACNPDAELLDFVNAPIGKGTGRPAHCSMYAAKGGMDLHPHCGCCRYFRGSASPGGKRVAVDDFDLLLDHPPHL